MSQPFPVEITRFGGLVVTDTVVTSLGLSIAIVLAARIAMALPAARATMEIGYEALEGSIRKMVTADVAPLVPLIVTQWIFIGCANLAGVVPRLASPTRDLALTAALAVIAFLAGHVFALKRHGLRYLRQYIEPTPILLPLSVIELGHGGARVELFGNIRGGLISAIVLCVAGLLVPVPLMLLSVLTGVVQAYIFGVLTLVFAASSLEIAGRPRKAKP